MSNRCSKCHAPREGDICWKCGEETFVPHESWTDPELPDISTIRGCARLVGYAVGVHGSLERDLDLIAAPWTEEAVSADDLAMYIAVTMNAKIVDREEKPLGRIAYSIQIDGWYKIIDLSVSPRG